jgi:hypothetical protein
MTKLEGTIVAELEPALTADALLSSYAQTAQLLRELHRLPLDAFGYIGPDGIMMSTCR